MGKVSEHTEAPIERMTMEQPGVGNPRRRRRALILADEADVAQLIRDNLAPEGWDIFTASASHALEHVRNVRPDVVLLDIGVPQLDGWGVPQLDGWEVYRRLKDDQETRTISVIMLVGRLEGGEKVLGFEAGADAIVILP